MKAISPMYIEQQKDLREVERVLSFCGIQFHDEMRMQKRHDIAATYKRWIMSNEETRSAFQHYKPNVNLPMTFSTRMSGLAVAIANYIKGNDLYDRQTVAGLPHFQNNTFYQRDPIFGEHIDELLGKADTVPLVLGNNLCTKPVVRIADFGCAPKRGGSSSLLFLKSILTRLFTDRQFEFYGYDIDFRPQYPVFSDDGTFTGWEDAYNFDRHGIARLNGDVYYNAQNPLFNIMPKRKKSQFVNTFNPFHNQYDIIVNSMFYAVFEMNGEPPESLAISLYNMLAMRSPDGILFLNTCDGCFKIFPAPDTEPHQNVIPFISTLDGVERKIANLLTGNVYCRGVYRNGHKPDAQDYTKIEKAVYRAHRLATSGITLLDRLFEAYERINEGSDLDHAISVLTDPAVSIPPARRAAVRDKIYSIRRKMTKRRASK